MKITNFFFKNLLNPQEKVQFLFEEHKTYIKLWTPNLNLTEIES